MPSMSLSNITVTPTTDPLVVTANQTKVSDFVSNTLLQVIQIDGQNARMTVNTYGGVTAFTGNRANGTAENPTAVIADNALVMLEGRGYGQTGYGLPGKSDAAHFVIHAAENWTDTARGSYARICTVQKGTASPSIERWRVNDDGTFTVLNFHTWPSYASDADAAAAGVQIDQSYRNGSALQFRAT